MGDDRSMVRSGQPLSLLAVVAIDLDGTESLDDGSRSEEKVDSQSVLSMEGPPAVVPPAEGLGVGLELAVEVDQVIEVLQLAVGPRLRSQRPY